MIKIESGGHFDEKKKRNLEDRAIVNELGGYAEAQGGTAAEYELDDSHSGQESANFVFLWKDETVAAFHCNMILGNKGYIEIEPPCTLAKLRNLQEVRMGIGYKGDFSFLGKLKGLSVLTIKSMPKNEDSFPSSWACASALRSLSLDYYDSSIAWVPDTFRNCQELREIEIAASRSINIEIPDWLGEFPHLERVFLNGHFASIPYSLTRMNLPFTEDKGATRGVILDHVTLDEGDVGMYLSNNRELIEAFYSGEQITEGEAIRECKVIFLGDGGVGKSSLIQRLMENTFELGKLPTDGMRVIPWTTKLEDNRDFRIRFLDFGGQEIMHSMHRCFLSGHTVYVVVCAARDDTEIDGVAARWLEQVKAYAPDCPIILVLNKADENPGISVNETNLRERFSALKMILKTSAKGEKGSDYYAGRLCDAIMKYAPSCVQELKGNRGMLAVKKALEEMSAQNTPYITAERYKKICNDNKIIWESLQRSMLEWFRDLGVAYFYEGKQVDWQLENLRVLNPVWLTNGIYRLILRAGKNVRNGVLTHQAIREILKTSYNGDAEEDVIYSPEETEYVLHVMRMFEISHEMPEGRELIPMLMEKNAEIMDSFSKQAIHLRWEGAFLPNNLIHKLMIQKYDELDLQFMWRTGARFRPKHEKCTATAMMKDDKSLDLYVIGGEGDHQREYLNDFRKKIQNILLSLNLQETKEYICCTVNGKEGKVAYETVVSSYKRGLPEIPIEGTQGFVSPMELLKQVEKNPEQNQSPAVGKNESRKDTSSEIADTQKKRAEKLQIYFNMGLKILGVLAGLYLLIKGGISLKDLFTPLIGGK